MPDPITLFEYDQLCASPHLGGSRAISPEAFEALEVFLGDLTARDEKAGQELHEVFRLTSCRGRKVLKAQNYVGVITAADAVIEILPKIGKLNRTEEQTRQTFLAMLAELREAPFKNLGHAPLTTQKLPIAEVFISSFLDEVREVIKRGICSDYREWEGNERFVKGRINFSEHLRRNHTDQSRIYVEYSIYHVDRPENRLLKACLNKLARESRSAENRRRIKIALDHLAEVTASTNVRGDFLACKNDRNLAHYETVLTWCRIFLAGEAPTSFPGIVSADALLFPMERIFEDYVAARLKREAAKEGLVVRAQDRRKHLFDSPSRYQLKPDLVVSRPRGRTVILDTKWKIPSDGTPSQADMYQMFAYAARYGVDDVTLIYPSENESSGAKLYYETKIEDRTVRVHTFHYALPDGKPEPGSSKTTAIAELLKLISGQVNQEP